MIERGFLLVSNPCFVCLFVRSFVRWFLCLVRRVLFPALGNNEFLREAAVRTGIFRFIHSVPLERGSFVPLGLESWSKPKNGVEQRTFATGQDVNVATDKVCADVIEALLGLVYMTSGYGHSTAVARELGLVLRSTKQPVTEPTKGSHRSSVALRPCRELVELCGRLTGRVSFNNAALILEAFTHPSANLEKVPSYQRLEWIGDAVLCLAIREWIFRRFPNRSVGDMVLTDGALVSNELLGFIAVTNGLHLFLTHRDQSLPSRLEHYEWTLKEEKRSVWATGM